MRGNIFFKILLLSCMKVSSTVSVGKTVISHNTLAIDSEYKVSTSTNDNQNQINQRQKLRNLSLEIVDEKVPITKEYGSMTNYRYGEHSNGKGNGSASPTNVIDIRNDTWKSKGKGANDGKSNGKGGNVNSLPGICANAQNMKGKMGKGSTSQPKSKVKSNTKGSEKKSKKSKKNRVLKRSKGEGASKQMNKGKGNAKLDKCSKFEFEHQLQGRTLYDQYDTILDAAREISEISVFVSLLHRFDLSYILECDGPFTGLIPTNNAFSLLDPIAFADLFLPTSTIDVEQLLLNHLFAGIRAEDDFMEDKLLSLSGFDVVVNLDPLTFNNNATAVETDIFGSNGVLHLVDGVILASAFPNVCDTGEFDFVGPTNGQNCTLNVIDVACNEPELSIFLSLIEAAMFQDIFTCSGPFTVLAPTNEAFNELGIENVDKWLDTNDIKAVTNVLLYHILPGLNLVENLVAGDLETLLSGNSVTVTINPVQFDNSSVITADIEGCNGVVHILDAVLVPDNNPGANLPTNAPTPLDTSFLPSDLPSLAPNSGSVSPTGISPVASGTPSTPSPTASMGSDMPSLMPQRN